VVALRGERLSVAEDYFGERVAARFDERYAHLADPAIDDFATTTVPGTFSHHYWIEDGKVEVFSPPFRYVWRERGARLGLGAPKLML
jgi:hypothetical protein